ncbi:hypothetical protein VNI00_009842 [Paramarasmius palmivorus]|uniref:Uncharacterized protein n=1 Tax=Paramarasmius palmivorus TaxID=297713 RepID=A0AAW0CMJ1_9AGAR
MGFNIFTFLRFGSRRASEKPEKNESSPPSVYRASNSDDPDSTLGETQAVANQSVPVQESEPQAVEIRPVLASNASGPPPPYTNATCQDAQVHPIPIPEEQEITDGNRNRDDSYPSLPGHDAFTKKNPYRPMGLPSLPLIKLTAKLTIIPVFMMVSTLAMGYYEDTGYQFMRRNFLANGVSTIDDFDTPKAFRTETLSDYAVTNNDADLIMDGGNPNVRASKRGSRRTVGHSYVTVNRASGTLTNNGSTLPAAYVEYTQNRMLRMREAQRRMEARYAAQTKPPEATEETKQRELENLV